YFSHVISTPPSSTPFPYTTLFRSEYPHFLEDYAQFYFDHSEEIKKKLLTHKEVAAVGDKGDMFDRYLHVDFYIRYCPRWQANLRSEEHTSELQSRFDLVCRLLLEK